MNWRFLLAIGVIVLAVGILVVSAVSSSAKAVVTVNELISAGTGRENIRLGARVTSDPIQSSGGVEHPEVRFSVKDITKKEEGGSEGSVTSAVRSLPVVYDGLQPDTLKAERDVILEGNFDGKQFRAKNLMTQCPSKYKPPTPGN